MPCRCCEVCGYHCDECTALYVADMERQAAEEAKRQQEEYEAGLHACTRCGGQAWCGQCESKECRRADDEEYFRSLIDEAAWACDDEGDSSCDHSWLLEFETDCDVTVARTCRKCRRSEAQTLLESPEPPNCYIPGEGWRIV